MKDLTQGKPLRLILLFALPIFFGNLFQQLYNLVDVSIVGQKLGSEALAAVGATSSVVSLMFGFVFGFNNGFGIIIAQNYGAGKMEEMKKSVASALMLGACLMILMTAAGLGFIRPLLVLLNTPEEILPTSLSYVNIVIMGLCITMTYNVLAGILRALGNSVAPLVFLVISTVLNIGLDFLLVYGFLMGVRGAAIATVLAQLTSAICCIIYIIRKCPELKLSARHFRPDGSLIGKMLLSGISMALMLAIVSIGSVILQSGINDLGTDIIAAHTAARKIDEMLMLPISTIGAATSTFASQNFGARKYQRIRQGTKLGVLLTFGWSLIAILIIYLFAPFLVGIITDGMNQNIIDTACFYLRFNLPFFFALGGLAVLRNVLQGIGMKITPIAASIIELLGKLLVIKLLVPILGYLGVCLAEPVIWVVDAILVAVVFFVGAPGKEKNENTSDCH